MEAEFAVTQSLSINAGIERYSTDPEEYGRETYGLETYSILEGNAGFTFDTRDFPLNPGKGVYHHLSVTFGRRRGAIADEGNDGGGQMGTVWDRSIVTDFQIALPLAYRHVAFLAFHGAQMKSGGTDIPYSQWFFMGGARSLRGYREKQFRSTTLGWWNLEYRLLPERRSRIFAFFDAGFYKTNPGSEGDWEKKTGYGLGFRVNSRLGIIGMDYGIGEDGGFSNGKIHVSIENRF
jgi:outer membrane protein insertion porin family